MPISTLRGPRLTSQQIADFMLSADRERRDAKRRGDALAAARHEREVNQLAKLL